MHCRKFIIINCMPYNTNYIINLYLKLVNDLQQVFNIYEKKN